MLHRLEIALQRFERSSTRTQVPGVSSADIRKARRRQDRRVEIPLLVQVMPGHFRVDTQAVEHQDANVSPVELFIETEGLGFWCRMEWRQPMESRVAPEQKHNPARAESSPREGSGQGREKSHGGRAGPDARRQAQPVRPSPWKRDHSRKSMDESGIGLPPKAASYSTAGISRRAA